MRSGLSLSLLPGPLWLGMIVPVKVTSLGQTELFNHLLYWKPFNYVQINDKCLIELLVLDNIAWNNFTVANRSIGVNYTWNYSTVSKQMRSGSFTNDITCKLFVYKLYIYIYIYIYILLYFIFWIRTVTPHSLLCDRSEACKESSDETESIAIIFSAEINLLWRLNRVWVSIKLYHIYIYIYKQDLALDNQQGLTYHKTNERTNHNSINNSPVFGLL